MSCFDVINDFTTIRHFFRDIRMLVMHTTLLLLHIGLYCTVLAPPEFSTVLKMDGGLRAQRRCLRQRHSPVGCPRILIGLIHKGFVCSVVLLSCVWSPHLIKDAVRPTLALRVIHPCRLCVGSIAPIFTLLHSKGLFQVCFVFVVCVF